MLIFRKSTGKFNFSQLSASLKCYEKVIENFAKMFNGFKVPKLLELAANEAANSIPFELVKQYPQLIPYQLRFTIWSFPVDDEDIRMYSVLYNGSTDEFVEGNRMLWSKAVKDPLQIGFYLSATIHTGIGKPSQSTSVTFDRKRIVACHCTCNSSFEWCEHAVALCLLRIHQPSAVKF